MIKSLLFSLVLPLFVSAPVWSEDLAKTASALIKRSAMEFEKSYPTTGFKTETELSQAIEEADPIYKTAAQILRDEDVEVAIATSEKIRDGIAFSGVLNTHETKTSGGTTMVDRNEIESKYLHVSKAEYSKLNNRVKPKYGFLAPKAGSSYGEPMGVFNYGSDRLILKLDKIRDRLTLTVGDSLNWAASSMFASNDLTIPMNSWDSHFVPWSYRMVFAPLLGQAISPAKSGEKRLPRIGLAIEPMFKSEQQLEDMGANSHNMPFPLQEQKDRNEVIPWTLRFGNQFKSPDGKLGDYRMTHDWGLDYIEAQIWGPVTLDEVKAFEFKGTPPSGKFLAALKAHGIEIRDKRK